MTQTPNIRVALFSGNYNYVRDGANQSLNRLVGYLLRQGVEVRIYAPKVEEPAFEPTGTLIGTKSFPIPGREEYRFPYRIGREALDDLTAFAPDIVHVASPDPVSYAALHWAKRRDISSIATVHTRFDTYLGYYSLGFLKPLMWAYFRRFYQHCFKLLAPVESIAEELRERRMNDNVGIWSRGVDRARFHEDRRDMAWRRAQGFADEDVVVLFLGRLVLEKGIDVFAKAVRKARGKGADIRILVVGDGPERGNFAEMLGGDAVFTGSLTGDELPRAVASADIFVNPSTTETFGNVTLEAMSCGLPVVAASATGATALVHDGVNGRLCRPDKAKDFAAAILDYSADAELRAAHGAAGIADAGTRDWDKINRAVLDAYSEARTSRTSSKAA